MIAGMEEYKNLSIILKEREHKGILNEAFPGHFIPIQSWAHPDREKVSDYRDLYVTCENEEVFLRDKDNNPVTFYHAGDEKLFLWAFAPPRVMKPDLLPYVSHLPRIEYKDIVLYRETWNMASEELLEGSENEIKDLHIRIVQKKWDLPDTFYIKLSAQKKPIFIDINNPLLVELFYSEVKKSKYIRISEMLPGPDSLFLKDSRGKYCSELRIGAFRCKKAVK
jgi:hypothetical protein